MYEFFMAPCRYIIFKPSTEWLKIKNEKLPAKKLFITYTLTTAKDEEAP
jgi:hypothetical protein